jgi:hypothetical protein
VGAAFGVRTEGGCDRLQNAGAVLDNIVVPKAKYPPPIQAQYLVPYLIAGGPVLSAIGFDDKTRLYAGKVDNIGRYRVLPSEPPAELVMAKLRPEHPLCFRHLAAQTASASNDRGTTPHVPTAPLFWGNPAVPSPPAQGQSTPPPFPSPACDRLRGRGILRPRFCIVVVGVDRVSSPEQCRTGEA